MATLEESARFLQVTLPFTITFHHDTSLYQKGHLFTYELNLPATQDAQHLALSEHLNAKFWTCDRACPGFI